MTFFYDLNKKLDSIREKPEVTHGQLNERDMSRAAKGYEKYGKQGMQALAKAGREGKALDPVRAKYDKYDESVEEASGDYSAKKAAAGKDIGKPGKNFEKIAKSAGERYGSKAAGERVAGAVLNKLRGKNESQLNELSPELLKRARDKAGMKYAQADDRRDQKASDKYNAQDDKFNSALRKKQKDMDEGMGDAVKKVGGAVLNRLGHGSDEDMRKDLQRKMGMPQTGDKPDGALKYAAKTFIKHAKDPLGLKNEAGAPMTSKQKSFAKLAPPADKITFADKIAGAKKEVDEMLGDVAAEAMKSALSGGQKKLDKNNNGRLDANDFAMLRKGGKQETDEGFDDMEKDVKNRMSARKVGDVTHGAKHDTQEIPGGRRVTRRTDPNTGYSVGADDDKSADGEKRGRGRPKGTKGAIGAKGPSGRSKLMTREGDNESDDIKQAMAMLKKAGYKVSKAVEEESTTTRDNRAERAGRKVAKDIEYDEKKKDGIHGKKRGSEDAKAEKAGKKVAKDIEYDEKKKKVKEQGGADTPTASSGFSFGKGIYDSLDRELESMISEGMNINMSMSSDANGGPSKSLTVTATDEDAIKLSQLLKSAGLGGGNDQGYGGSGYQSACGCGTPDCSCGDQEMDEAYGDTQPTLNEPDYPTNTETAEDNFEYAGGLNKPKSTGQTTVPVIASQEERQESYAAEEEDAIKRMMEMAGVKKKTDEEKTEEGNLFTGNLAKARADGKKQADLDGDGDMEKVDEGILASTANLWKEYKGQYGV